MLRATPAARVAVKALRFEPLAAALPESRRAAEVCFCHPFVRSCHSQTCHPLLRSIACLRLPSETSLRYRGSSYKPNQNGTSASRRWCRRWRRSCRRNPRATFHGTAQRLPNTFRLRNAKAFRDRPRPLPAALPDPCAMAGSLATSIKDRVQE